MSAIRSLALVLFVTLAFAADSAEAATRVFAGKIRNQTNNTVTYQYRHKYITKNQWVTVSLKPGGEAVYSVKGPQVLGGAEVELRYDHTLNDKTIVLQYTTLAMWGCNRPQDGYFQGFVIANSGRTLYLHR